MRIDLNSIDRTKFQVEENTIISTGDTIFFVKPDLDAIQREENGLVWTQENKIFRSSVWNADGELVSSGFPKFVNWGENPQNFPVPQSLKDAVIVEKMDGSLLIVSKYRGHYILRTRGTLDASSLKNGTELGIFRDTILRSLIHSDNNGTWNLSWLFEWTSPTQRIVIGYGDEPKWTLVGIVNHEDYSLVEQKTLDVVAKSMGFNRPETYKFSTVEELLQNVDQWKGKEGVVSYTNKGQTLHKVKSADYLAKHRFKSQATLENTLELFFVYDKPQYKDFEQNLVKQFDYECFGMVRGYASSICDASRQVGQIIEGITSFINPLKSLPRKDAAQSILSSYGISSRSDMAFTLLDGKSLSVNQQKKLYWQVLKRK